MARRNYRSRPQYNGTNLPLANEVSPASHVGSRDGHPTASATLAGFLSAADKAKLDAGKIAYLAHAASGQSIATGNIDQKMLLDVADFADVGSVVSSGWSAGASGTGTYVIGAVCNSGASVDQAQLWLRLYKNGVEEDVLDSSHSSHTRQIVASGSIPIKVTNANDTYSIWVSYVAPGGSPSVSILAGFSCMYVER